MEEPKTWTPPSLEQLGELKSGLNAVSYKTKIGKKPAQQLYRSVKLQLTGPEDIMGILLYDAPVHWSSILREEPVVHKDDPAKDVEEILKALFKWLDSIGYVEGWSVSGVGSPAENPNSVFLPSERRRRAPS